jgi:hypothetical protein
LNSQNDIYNNNSSNRVLIGRTGISASGYSLDVSGSIHTSQILFVDSSIQNPTGDTVTVQDNLTISGICSATTFVNSSDYRIKENIQNIGDLVVDNIRPVKYNFKNDNKEEYGFIAHEIQDIFPSLVIGEKDGEEIQRINYNGFIPILVKEIKELKQKYNKQQKIIDQLIDERVI